MTGRGRYPLLPAPCPAGARLGRQTDDRLSPLHSPAARPPASRALPPSPRRTRFACRAPKAGRPCIPLPLSGDWARSVPPESVPPRSIALYIDFLSSLLPCPLATPSKCVNRCVTTVNRPPTTVLRWWNDAKRADAGGQ